MKNRHWSLPLASFTVAVALIAGLSSCTPEASRPVAWDSARGALVVGDAKPRLHLWLEYGSPGTKAFLQANADRLRTWQDAGTMTISYHAVSVPGSSKAIESYSRMAGATVAAVGENDPDQVVPTALALSKNIITRNHSISAKQIQRDLAKSGVTVDVPAAEKTYSKSLTSANDRNTKKGPVRVEPSATFNGTFINTDHTFSAEMAFQLRKLAQAQKK